MSSFLHATHHQAVPGMICELDDRIEALDAESIALRRYRNSLLPIFQIPADILSRIHLFLLDEPATEDRGRNLTIERPYLQRFYISGICHYWRTIAINDSRLWRWVDFEYPGFIPLILQRSKHFPLSVRLPCNVNSRRQGFKRAFILVRHQLYRVHNIYLFSQASPIANQLRLLLAQTPRLLPPLRKLTLGYHSHHLDEGYHLLSCPTLTHLSLIECKRYPLSEFISILQPMPQLQYLKLVHCLPTPDIRHITTFPAPATLIIEDSLNASYNFLSRIALTQHPSTFDLTCRSCPGTDPRDDLGSTTAGHILKLFASHWTIGHVHSLELFAAPLHPSDPRVEDMRAVFSQYTHTGSNTGNRDTLSRFTVEFSQYKWRTSDHSSEYEGYFAALVNQHRLDGARDCRISVPHPLGQLLHVIMARMPGIGGLRRAQTPEGLSVYSNSSCL
ncbi:hypothetical protein AX16_009247 [Volvariella volvacea WC 439]|nr:hypothetical protein AX16_009247 [Volvariella volvacea WC 439]